MIKGFCPDCSTKLELEGKVVYIRKGNGAYDSLGWTEHQNVVDNYKALLINIEPIEKCKHPVEKVSKVTQVLEHGLVNGPKTLHEWDKGYQCECGAKVKPTQFEEIE